MARTARRLDKSKSAFNPTQAYSVALYIRLSREDGDKEESNSVLNQRKKLMDYISGKDEFSLFDVYDSDDGYSGLSFDRPDFKRMMSDIERNAVNCVIVKDLSRFGRDYIGVGEYLERVFPQKGVRFIAVDDNIDSHKVAYDMMTPIRNVFNEQYAADISRKVKSALRTKQENGEFIGAFAPYGYRKDPNNNSRLVIDEYAAGVVRRIFDLYADGCGKISIAKQLNAENIPCPSVYKDLDGQNYTNGRRIDKTSYWTYATILRVLNHRVYIGDMVQGRSYRQSLKVKAKQTTPENWIIVEGTHEPIITKEVWDAVQDLLGRDTRHIDFTQNISVLAGFLVCGDCGRAMSKNTHKHKDGSERITYRCGSHQRYGAHICSPHTIDHDSIVTVLLNDINDMASRLRSLSELVRSTVTQEERKAVNKSEIKRIEAAIEKTRRLRRGVYEDYKAELLSLDDYKALKYQYENEEATYLTMLETLSAASTAKKDVLSSSWAQKLLTSGKIETLDRVLLAELVDVIKVYDGAKIEITYKVTAPEI